MGFLTGTCSGDGIPLFFSSPLWTSAGAEHGEEGHLAEFHRPAMVAASLAAPLVIGAPTPPRTAEQGGRGRRATRPVVDLGGVVSLRDREIQVIVVWNGETRIIITVLFSSPKCRILTLLALQLQWTGGWFKRQCLPFDPAAAPGSASGKLEHPTSGRLSGPIATGRVGGGATVSYSDYNSFKYSALADLLSAVLQGVAIYLEVVKKEKAAKVVELIDKLLLALTSTSATLLFAVDDITSCGVGRQRSSSRICAQAGRFCGQIRASSAFSLAAASSVSVSVYARHAPLSITLKPKALPPVMEIPTLTRKAPPPVVQSPTLTPKAPPQVVKIPTPTPQAPPTTGTKCEGEGELCLCTQITTEPPPLPVMPRPCCGCPRLTIPHGCENHDRAMMTEPKPCVQVLYASVPTRQATQPHEMYSYEPQRLGFYIPS
ncbi:hypothetical protein ACQ4PT_058603 [Festuca glaucescens]